MKTLLIILLTLPLIGFSQELTFEDGELDGYVRRMRAGGEREQTIDIFKKDYKHEKENYLNSLAKLTIVTDEEKIRMNLPKDFIQESSEDKYSIINASKYDSEGYIQATIEVKYSDDWSFSMFTNEEYIDEILNSNKVESTAGIMFDDFEFHIKEKLFLIGIGDCVSLIYSGAYKSNGIRITNLSIQFIKNNKLYTLIGSSLPENFSENYKDFLKSFDTLKF